jgi:ribosomal protein L27
MSIHNTDPITGQLLSDYGYVRKFEEVNAFLTYTGKSKINSADGSTANWQIQRALKIGSEWTYSYAAGGSFNQIWDDRATLTYPGQNTGTNLNNTLSCSFDGINDYVTAGDAFNYEHSQQFSVSLWIKPNNFAATRVFIGNVDSSVNGWRIYHDTSGQINTQTRSAGGAYGPTVYTDSVLTALAWNHVVLTWGGGSNNNQARIWLNGVQSAIVPSLGTLTTTWLGANNLEIGRGPANYFSGSIDEVSLWNKVLDSTEIAEIYNVGTPNDLSTVSASSNLVNWYRMGDGDTYPTILDQISPAESGTMTNMTSGSITTDVP